MSSVFVARHCNVSREGVFILGLVSLSSTEWVIINMNGYFKPFDLMEKRLSLFPSAQVQKWTGSFAVCRLFLLVILLLWAAALHYSTENVLYPSLCPSLQTAGYVLSFLTCGALCIVFFKFSLIFFSLPLLPVLFSLLVQLMSYCGFSSTYITYVSELLWRSLALCPNMIIVVYR